eukprot:g14718.t1
MCKKKQAKDPDEQAKADPRSPGSDPSQLRQDTILLFMWQLDNVRDARSSSHSERHVQALVEQNASVGSRACRHMIAGPLA